MTIVRYGGHDIELDPTFQFGKDNLGPAFLAKFPLGKVSDGSVSSSVFQDDHLEKKSICRTPFLGVLGLYIHPLKDRLPQTSVEGCPKDLFI